MVSRWFNFTFTDGVKNITLDLVRDSGQELTETTCMKMLRNLCAESLLKYPEDQNVLDMSQHFKGYSDTCEQYDTSHFSAIILELNTCNGEFHARSSTYTDYDSVKIDLIKADPVRVAEIIKKLHAMKPIGFFNKKHDCFINAGLQLIFNDPELMNLMITHSNEAIRKSFIDMVVNIYLNQTTDGHADLIVAIRAFCKFGLNTQDSTPMMLVCLFGDDTSVITKTVTNHEDIVRINNNIFTKLNDVLSESSDDFVHVGDDSCSDNNMLYSVINNMQYDFDDGQGVQFSSEYNELKDFIHSEAYDNSVCELVYDKNLAAFQHTLLNTHNVELFKKFIQCDKFQTHIKPNACVLFDASGYGIEYRRSSIRQQYKGVIIDKFKLRHTYIPRFDKVYSIVVRVGKDPSCGHYISIINKNNIYYECNDSKVTQIHDISDRLTYIERHNGCIVSWSYNDGL